MRSLLLKMGVGLSALLLVSCQGTGDEGGSVEIGQRAPGFSLKALDGSTVASRSLAGNVVVLNFWATWCAPCVKEIPDLQQVAASSGAKVVGIALDEDGARSVKPFVEQHGLNRTANYTVLLGDQKLFDRFNGMGIPYTLLLDREQRVVKVYRGPTTREVLEQDVKEINGGV
jgi:thiol-disulfide isomerase/thioredoxin